MAALLCLQHLLTFSSLSVGDTLTPYTRSPLTQHFHFTAFCLQGEQTSRVHPSVKQPLSSITVNSSKAYWFYNTYCLLIYPPALMWYMHSLSYRISWTVKNIFKNTVIYDGRFPRKYLCDHSSVLHPRSLIFSRHPPTAPAIPISCFSACVCLWHHKVGTMGCRDSEPVMCVWGM